MITAIDAEKACDKTQNTFLDNSQQSRNRRDHTQPDKQHLQKPKLVSYLTGKD
jgi:hypothetical protein